jgi:hypothetical protein
MVTGLSGACGNTKRTGVRMPTAGTIGTTLPDHELHPFQQGVGRPDQDTAGPRGEPHEFLDGLLAGSRGNASSGPVTVPPHA